MTRPLCFFYAVEFYRVIRYQDKIMGNG